jgi:hypothetical protein
MEGQPAGQQAVNGQRRRLWRVFAHGQSMPRVAVPVSLRTREFGLRVIYRSASSCMGRHRPQGQGRDQLEVLTVATAFLEQGRLVDTCGGGPCQTLPPPG